MIRLDWGGRRGSRVEYGRFSPKLIYFQPILFYSPPLPSFLPPSKRTLKDKHIIIWLQIQLTIPKNHLLPLWLSSYFGTGSHISQTRKYIRDVWFTVMYLFFEKKIVMYIWCDVYYDDVILKFLVYFIFSNITII